MEGKVTERGTVSRAGAAGVAGAWWTSDTVWTAVQALGIGLVGALGVVVNVLCALIWSGRPALRSHSTRYVYNMLAANLLCAALLAPLDVVVLLVAPPPDLHGLQLQATADLLWPSAAVAAASAADPQVSEGGGVAAAALVLDEVWPALPALPAPWQVWLRELTRFAQGVAVQVSVFSVLLVALDRHKAVLSPLHYHRMATRQRSTILIVTNWLVTPLVTLLFQTRLIPYSQWIHFGIGFALPLYIIVYMYIQMSLAAHQNSKRTRRHSVCTSTQSGNGGNGGQLSLDAGSGSRGGSRGGSLDLSLPPFNGTPEHANKGDAPRRPGRNPPLGSIVLNNKRRCSNASFSTLLLREEGRAVKTALFVVGAYLLCWTPYFVFVVLQRQTPALVLLLAHVNSCVSPWIYVLRNEEVRLEAKKLVARLLHLNLPRAPQDSPGHGHSYGRSDSCYSKSMEASSHPAHPLRQQSSHCDSMSVQSFHLPTAAGAGAGGDLGGLGAAGLVGYHHGPSPLGALGPSAGSDTPLTADSLCSAGESPGPMTGGNGGGGGLVRLAYKYPAQYNQYTLQRGRSQTCIRQNSDSSSGSGRPLLQSDQLQQERGQGRGGGGRRRLGSSGASGDSGSDQETPRHASAAAAAGLDDDGSPPPLTPQDRERDAAAASRRRLLHRDSLEEEDEDQLSPAHEAPAPPPAIVAALRRLSAHAPPPTPPRRSSLCGSSACRRSSLKMDGNIFQFDNILVDGGDPVTSLSAGLSSASIEQADNSTVSGDSGICIAAGSSAACAGGADCISLLAASAVVTAAPGPAPGSVLRPPPPPRNKLKRIEAVEESVCDTTFSTCGNGHAPPPASQPPFQLWAMGVGEFSPPPPAPPAAPQHCGQAAAAAAASSSRMHKMTDIRNLVKTSLHRPAFRIPKADF
ncbi:Annetocin receptor [Frankliniella fusca]|uniref:Annetocin receptor n=1 Tax=Frankliniella fusca TaxID=407009 RepID=A0AAE1GW86_9NEOP|nr:Annetocin receptor [Frankliniella fusca]